jgi:putative chitinase
MVTKDQLLQITPEVKYTKFKQDDIVKELNVLSSSILNTKLRLAAFIAQTAHESGSYCVAVENLNYSDTGLLKIFSKYFNATNVHDYARNPQKIASRVYANRLGNGPEDSGDGWNYRGRGFIQITGKENYTKCGKSLGIDLIANPAYLETIEGAMMSAKWFWESNNLNEWADKPDFVTLTKRINGGVNGLMERREFYDRAMIVLQ